MDIANTIKELEKALNAKVEELAIMLREYKASARTAKCYSDRELIESQWNKITALYDEIKPAYDFIAKESKLAAQAIKGPLKLEIAHWRYR